MTNSNAGGAITVADAPSISCWVIVDPRLVQNGPLDELLASFARHSGLRPVWRPTSDRETAAQLATAAVQARAARVVAIGDEVTIRTVASVLANTGVPLGIVPVGSGRQLARSIGAPSEHKDAVAAALGGFTSVLDLMKVTIDSGQTTSSFISVGVEGGTAGPLTTRSAQHPNSHRIDPDTLPWFGATATVDQQRPTYIRSAAWVIGIGSRLSTAARPNAGDRLLHVSMLRARRGVGARKRYWSGTPPVRRRASADEGETGRRVLLVLDDVKPYYLDGTLAGHATTVTAEIQPAALTMLVPLHT
jgi:hypothetical protein